jgi:hypothetical protein
MSRLWTRAPCGNVTRPAAPLDLGSGHGVRMPTPPLLGCKPIIARRPASTCRRQGASPRRTADRRGKQTGCGIFRLSHGACGAVILGRARSSSVGGTSRREMPDRILTSHAGSLPRPEDLITLNARRAAEDFTEEAEYLGRLRGRGRGRRSAPARNQHRPRQRRRIRPFDGHGDLITTFPVGGTPAAR